MGVCLRRRLCLGGGTRTLPFVRRFTPREIEAATKGFTAVLEAGGPRGAATAYRARFAGGLVATVRRAAGSGRSRDDEQQGSGGGKAAFYLELQLLARLNHRHVVRLRGFAEAHHARFLVFDHMENRSLKECLHDPLRTPLDWRTRLQVAIDIAAALEYLYYFCDPPVFHVAVNSGNVLMDANFVAKLSDVSVISHDMKLPTTESFQGFRGANFNSSTAIHAKPSKFLPILHCSHLLENCSCSDQVEERRAGLVFQYGVLVLELVTGQSPGGDGELVRWVQEPGFAGSMHRMVDADLGGVYDARELRDLVIVARLCTRHGHGGDDGGAVVSIPQIVRYLQGKVERLGVEASCG
ncbi:probable receptor-like protein kinase At1g49730 isoform X1 [Setaria viridis]|uniref:probable receptor-like protein kinase At1g49730 isoform X1 n=1 Tax=Setaria viridis TaxID=4556 RepID=UPI0014938823|nr:probable receptor-like protein kinase At1g49730 isoform X1 [Setaria viridis]